MAPNPFFDASARIDLRPEDIRHHPLSWQEIPRTEALRSFRDTPVAVVHRVNGIERVGWFDQTSPYFQASRALEFSGLKYFLLTNAAARRSLKGLKAFDKPEEVEMETFEFPTVQESDFETPAAPKKPALKPAGLTPPGVPIPPAVPSKPGFPGLPDLPRIPDLPSLDIPTVPEIPALPGIPAIPGIPAAAGIPAVPAIPGIPGIPAIPGIPPVPGLPGVVPPGLPQVDLSLALALGAAGVTPPDVAVAEDVAEAAKRAPEKTFFAVRVVDELGEPVDGVPLTLTAAGKPNPLKTQGGDARLDDVDAGQATVEFADPDGLRNALKARWDKNDRLDKARFVKSGPATVMALAAPLAKVDVASAETHTISIQPRVIKGRTVGMFFDTSKTFLLPGAVEGLKHIQEFCDLQPGGAMLIVGHTDTAGKPEYNDLLSFDRAEAIQAYFKKDAEGWLKWYAKDVKDEKRWGWNEDHLMMKTLPDGKDLLNSPDPTRKFQKARGLKESGAADAETRKRLVTEYMALTPAPQNVSFTTHGCGENFLQKKTADGTHEQLNRDVELFLFDGKLGVQPPPPGKNSGPGSKEYPEWQNRALEIVDITAAGVVAAATIGTRVPMRFSNRKSFPKPHSLAMAKELAKRMSENPALTLVLVGHADATGTDEANKKVSEARAEAMKAWICKDRKFFLDRFRDPDKKIKWDWEEVQWMLHAMRDSGSPCYVGQADGFPGRRTLEALGLFQVSTADLPPTHVADTATLERLVDSYLELIDSPIDKARVTALGGGNWHPPQPMGANPAPDIPDDSPDRRRVDGFLFQGQPEPPVSAFPKGREGAPEVYAEWSRRAKEEAAAEAPKFFLEFFDPTGKALADTDLTFSKIDPDTGDVALGALKSSGRGSAEVAIEPGVIGVGVQIGSETFSGSFLLDIDGSCGAALSFNREGGMVTASGASA